MALVFAVGIVMYNVVIPRAPYHLSRAAIACLPKPWLLHFGEITIGPSFTEAVRLCVAAKKPMHSARIEMDHTTVLGITLEGVPHRLLIRSDLPNADSVSG